MTESDIYQLVGEAYCNGMVHGMEKSAALEKQALSPNLLLEAANKALSLGKVKQAINLLGGAKGRNIGKILSETGTNAESVAKVVPGLNPKGADQVAKWLLNGGHKNVSRDTLANVLEAGHHIPRQLSREADITKYLKHFGGGFSNTYTPVRIPQNITPLSL